MTLRFSERTLGRCIFAVLLAGLMASSVSLPAKSSGGEAEKKAEAPNAVTAVAVVMTYADIAEAGYQDAQAAALILQAKIKDLIESPSDTTLAAAQESWKEARIPYMQTEVFRFGNSIVDDWEGKVNAWPLDEGLIDYVNGAYGADSAENELYAANVVAKSSLKIAGKQVDASQITADLLSNSLQEAGGVEANVATGYHAVEFLLWGQDLNGTKPGAGVRPATDYDLKNCTNGNCDRRVQYLTVVTQLLADDLGWMAEQWGEKGAARAAVLRDANKDGLAAVFKGMGSLSYGELAGERMRLGLMIHDPEEEQDCFSDNTHNAHFYNALGIENVYLGRYKRTDGTIVSGPSVSDLVKAKSAETDEKIREALENTKAKMTALVTRAATVETYDVMIGEDNTDGNTIVQAAIDALISQTKEFESGVAVVGLKAMEFEGSDSLDDPAKVGADAKAEKKG